MSKNTFVLPNKGAVKKTKPSGNSAKDDGNSTRRVTKNSNLNQTTLSHRGNNTTIVSQKNEDAKDLDDITKKLSYNEFLESLYMEVIMDEKIKDEESEIDIKLAELAKRLEINKFIIRKTQDRLKDISFLSDQQRILNEKKLYTDELLKEASELQIGDLLDNFNSNQDMYCDRLLTKNIDLGVKENGAYEELHAAVISAGNALDNIKINSKLGRNEVDVIGNISRELKECEAARECIENNLKQHQLVESQVSSNVLEVASIELASTLT